MRRSDQIADSFSKQVYAMSVNNPDDFYDETVAASYDLDSFGILQAAQDEAISSFSEILKNIEAPKVLDLPCGTGNLLRQLKDIHPTAKLTGVDLSPEMIQIAKKKLADSTVNLHVGKALDIDRDFPEEHFDLICIHFIFGFVDAEALLEKCRKILKPNGYISIATSTWDSLPTLRSYAYRIASKAYVEKQAHCPKTSADLVKMMEKQGYRSTGGREICTDIHFRNYAEFYRFAHDEGWFTQYFDIVPKPIYYLLRCFFPLFFPLSDKSISYVGLLQKHSI